MIANGFHSALRYFPTPCWLAALWAVAYCGGATPATAAEPTGEIAAEQLNAEQLDFFESKIRPLLIEHCYECHSRESGEMSGDLLVDNAASLRRGGASGAAIVPGDPKASLLLRAVRYKDPQMAMPPQGKLSDEAIALLERWVSIGAPDPRREASSTQPPMSPMDIDPASHWAFVRPRRYDGELPPPHRDDRDVIDRIARRQAQQNGLIVAERADDRTLIRRLFHDLTGLPPTLDQIETFIASTEPNKFEALVDQLLASPAYAERFARHWMDVARYADTIGYALAGKDRRLKGSERYRDWLIRAFGSDLPFESMIRMQLAADRIDPQNQSGHLDAMGFLTIGRRFLNHYDTLDDRIDVISRGLLGLTVSCARCHDHKFDPIPSSDYYSLLGILQSSEQPEDGPSPLMLVDKASPADSHIFIRGQPGNHGDVAPRQYLTALRETDAPRFTIGSGRLELADRLAAKDNPLVPRVFVNRIWAVLIGRPIIDSTSDFGIRTRANAMVPILDELSADFAEHQSVKRLIRRIVLSRIYTQSSTPPNESAFDSDAENQWLARAHRKRLDFETMRDSMLAVCDMLDRQVGGAPVEIHLASPPPRRTLYAMIDRQNLPSLFRTFDVASPDAHAPKRYFTTVPQQALFLMNHPQMGILAGRLAQQLERHAESPAQQIESAFRIVLSRPPSEAELDQCGKFLATPARSREPRIDPRSYWRYGTSPVNAEAAVTQFRPLPVFTGSTWQDGPTLPASSEYRYASIARETGHPGPDHAVVRRWIAPTDGQIVIRGELNHPSDQGDGVELAIWIGGQRIWRESQANGRRTFADLRGIVKAGQTVDFVVSPRASDSFDSFLLQCTIDMRSADGVSHQADSRTDFSGPLPKANHQPLNRLAQLVQTLLLSNEFLFVD